MSCPRGMLPPTIVAIETEKRDWLSSFLSASHDRSMGKRERIGVDNNCVSMAMRVLFVSSPATASLDV